MRETIPPQALDRDRPQAQDKSALPDIVTSASTEPQTDGKAEAEATAEAKAEADRDRPQAQDKSAAPNSTPNIVPSAPTEHDNKPPHPATAATAEAKAEAKGTRTHILCLLASLAARWPIAMAMIISDPGAAVGQ